MREHDVTALTACDLERARRELAASLALTRPESLARTPTLAHLTAIDIELTRRTGRGAVVARTRCAPDRTANGPRAVQAGAAPPGSHVMQDYATRSEKARVTAAVRLETFNRV